MSRRKPACCCSPGGTATCSPLFVAGGNYNYPASPSVYQVGEDAVTHGGPYVIGGKYQRYQPGRCTRLLVYYAVSLDASVFDEIADLDTEATPDVVLVTSNGYCRGMGDPFLTDFEDEGSGLLDDEPYWWAACEVGGYATGTIGKLPTWAQLQTMITAGGSNITGGGTLLVGAQSRYYFIKQQHPTPIVLDRVAAENAKYWVDRIWFHQAA